MYDRPQLSWGVRCPQASIKGEGVNTLLSRAREIALLAALAACSSKGARPAPPTPGWYEIARTPEIAAYLDTGRIERAGDGVSRVWFRFRYVTPITLGHDTSTHYAAMETRQELDCAHRRTRGLELRMETSTGITTGAPTPDTAWSSIDTHVLNSGVFLVACRATGHPIPAVPGT